MCFPHCVLIGDFHASRKYPPHPLPSVFAFIAHLQCGGVGKVITWPGETQRRWRRPPFFKRSIKALSLWAAPLPPLAFIDPSGLRWMCEYGTRLFIYSPTPPRVLELLVPGRLQLTGGAVDLVKKKKNTQKKKAAQAWQDVHIPHQDDLLSQSG